VRFSQPILDKPTPILFAAARVRSTPRVHAAKFLRDADAGKCPLVPVEIFFRDAKELAGKNYATCFHLVLRTILNISEIVTPKWSANP
jgi:hypothetical protein